MLKLSLATRAFLISLLPLCLVMTFIFIGLNVALRDRTRDGIKRFVHTSEALLDRMNLLAGRAQYLAKQFQAAAETFEKVAHASPSLAHDSLFNASLAWLQLGDNARYLTDAQELSQSGGGSEEARGDLALEEGLTQAGQGNKKATETLQTFLRDFPKHKRAAINISISVDLMYS